MVDFISFENLSIGQPVKIAGKTVSGRGYLAVEIVLEPAETSPKLEGEVQAIDREHRSIRIFNRELVLQNGIVIKDLEESEVDFQSLEVGSVLKIKGKYVNGAGFVPNKIKMKAGQEFNIEEMQGILDHINFENRSFEVNGVTVLVNDKTVYQAS
jgi:hypothetical protein